MIKAQYTVVLKTLLDDEFTKAKIIDALSDYPLYKSDNELVKDLIPTRDILNQKLLNHYKYHEIGFETAGRFIDELNITMNEIMPYYNQMFNTVEIMAELPSPFDNVDVIEKYTETKQGTVSGESKNNTVASDSSNMTSNTNSDAKSVKSTTPQNELSVPAKDIDKVSYADQIDWNKNTGHDDSETIGNSESESKSESTGTSKETTEHTYTKTGNQGVNTYAHDMIEFRETIIDVTMKIVTDSRIKELFMMVY